MRMPETSFNTMLAQSPDGKQKRFFIGLILKCCSNFGIAPIIANKNEGLQSLNADKACNHWTS